MLAIASRTCRRWGLVREEHEIQDINFKTYPDDMTWKDYLANGGSTVVRLVKKTNFVPSSPIKQDGWPHAPVGGIGTGIVPGVAQQPPPFGQPANLFNFGGQGLFK